MSFEIINRRKKELGIGNAELAAMSGVPKATIDKITSGATANPSLETMKSIAHALNVSLDAFDDEPAVDAERRATLLSSTKSSLNKSGYFGGCFGKSKRPNHQKFRRFLVVRMAGFEPLWRGIWQPLHAVRRRHLAAFEAV